MKEIAVVILLVTAPRSLPGRPTMKCSELTGISFGATVKITSALPVPANGGIPEYCDVRGTIWPEATFAVKLPTDWNNRLYMVGNGGAGGTIPLAAMDVALRRGFATAGTDTGHHAPPRSSDDATRLDTTFARPGPDNPNATRKVIDFAYLSVHETAVLGKKS